MKEIINQIVNDYHCYESRYLKKPKFLTLRIDLYKELLQYYEHSGYFLIDKFSETPEFMGMKILRTEDFPQNINYCIS